MINLLRNFKSVKTNKLFFSSSIYQKSTLENSTEKYYRQAASLLKIDDDMTEFLLKPASTLKMNIPLLRDDGSVTMIPALRCHHKEHKLPLKGGLIINENVSISEVEALGLITSIKLAAVEVPYGGAAGAVCLHPGLFSRSEIDRVIIRMTIELSKYNYIGPGIDVIGPNFGSTPHHMDLIKNTYKNYFGLDNFNNNAIVTGKNPVNSGIEGRSEATGLGMFYCIKNIFEKDKFEKLRNKYKVTKGLKDKTVCIQGYGRVGKSIAAQMVKHGAKVICIEEWDGCVYNEDGINLKDLDKHFNERKGFQSYDDHNSEINILAHECDILVTAFSSEVITMNNVKQVKAKVIVEGANGATSFDADAYLEKKNILVLPDIIANSGGIIVSYIEWLKNIDHKRPGRLENQWDSKANKMLLKAIQKQLEKTGIEVDLENTSDLLLKRTTPQLVRTGLENIIDKAMDQIRETADEKDISVRLATFSNGLKRILRDYENDGLII